MKFGIFFVIGLWCLSLAAFGELSVNDLDKIRTSSRNPKTGSARKTPHPKRGRISSWTGTSHSSSLSSDLSPSSQASPSRSSHYNCEKSETGMSSSTSNDANSRTQQRQLIETLQQQLEGMNHELETLKQQRIFK